MKLVVNPDDTTISLTLRTTRKQSKTLILPKESIFAWYPFNINFTYRYSEAKQIMYLTKDQEYNGDNLYSTTTLKKTKRLPMSEGVPYHKGIIERNTAIMLKARQLGIPTLMDHFTYKDVQQGFETLGAYIQEVKEQLEDRYMNEGEEGWYLPEGDLESWDKEIFQLLTESEKENLIQCGEIYIMLSLMRRLTGGIKVG